MNEEVQLSRTGAKCSCIVRAVRTAQTAPLIEIRAIELRVGRTLHCKESGG
jgi:hypothetical protein